MSDSYLVAGERRAAELGNRGPLEFDPHGGLRRDISDAYWRTGFYIFAGLLPDAEVHDLVADFEAVLVRAPVARGAQLDAQDRPALGADLERSPFTFSKPLSDPFGGTTAARGRYGGRMSEHQAPADAPAEVVGGVGGPLQFMDAFLRLYGHPQLLAAAAHINGSDFVPFREAVWVKLAGLGPSTSWHQDGTTHWESPELDDGTHGFNFMTQLYPTNPSNALWLVPGSHHLGKIDIAALQAANGGSDRLPDAVPMDCQPGDVAIVNRQILHGSFANRSDHRRVSLTFGFHRRSSVLEVVGEEPQPFDAERIRERSRIIALAIDARRQRFPDEAPYRYQPLAAEQDAIHWNDAARETLLKDYNTKDLGI